MPRYSTHGICNNTCLQTLFRLKEPRNTTRNCIQKAILPFGENSHIIHGDMQRIMNTRGRVDCYNGLSNPSALIPSGGDDHHNPSSLYTLQRAEAFPFQKEKKKSCNSSVPKDQSATLSYTQETENKIEASGPLVSEGRKCLQQPCNWL